MKVSRRGSLIATIAIWLAGSAGCVLEGGTEDVRARASALGTFNVLTRNYGNQRTGANVSETVLTTANVNTSTFGKVFELPVDDQVYAGILYASNVAIAGGTHNVVYVATVNNSVYAFDADSGGNPLWRVSFNNGFRPPFHTEVGSVCGTYNDMSGNMGIVGTPVIDGASGTLYVVTRTVENSAFVQRLRALDITTGSERTPAQVIGTINPMTNNQRAALALSAGTVYVAWGSHCDTGPYNGFLLAFDAGTLVPLHSFNSTPGGSQGGIWMSGAAPIVDGSGNIFVATGNGSSSPTANQLSEAIIKLSPTLARLDYFMPSNFGALNSNDDDLGSSGPIVVPGTNLLVMGGKGGGNCYLVDMNNMGQIVSNDTQIPQKWQCADPDNLRAGQTHHLHNAMVAWNGPAGLNLYTWSENDFGRAWRFNGSTFNVPAISVSNVLPPLGMPGGLMTLSANGSTAGTGILWVTMPLNGDANQTTVPGVLTAFDAEDLTHELWDSTMVSTDTSWNLSKGAIPVVANGKVYVGSVSNVVSVYGLRNGGTNCVPETDAGFCARLGKNCGTVSDVDNCGAARTVGSCGACIDPATCGGGGTANFCGSPATSGDLTEGGIITGTGVACSANESVAQAYDNLMTPAGFSKWCVTAAPTTAVPISTVYDFAGSTALVVTSYTITTANDAPDRDPRDWTFQGCQGTCTAGLDTGWVVIDTRTGQFAGAARYQTNTYALSNTTAYQQYRLRVTANNGNATLFQVAEIQFFGASSGCTSETDAAFCTRLGMNCGQVSGTDNCGAARTVASCGICTSPQTCGGAGTANVCGSNICIPETDAAFCTRLGTNCGQVSGTDNCGAARTVASCGTCASPQTCGGAGFANVCAAPSSVDVTEGGTATGTGVACAANESVAQVYDNQSSTKWCVTSAPTMTVPIATVYDFAGTNSYVVTSYSLTTAADAPDRDPRDWTLQGCQGSCTAGSDAGWVVLDTRTGQFAGAGAFLTNTYPVGNTTAYQQYRLRVTANNGNASLFQVAEIQLFGTTGGCTSESDAAFCSRLGKNCGQVSGTDNCGAARTAASCGTCTSPQTCGGGGTANVCAAPACTPESDAAFCSRLGKNCGQVSGTDNCGAARTAACGTCTSPQTCGGGGTANVCAAPACTPESDAAFCSRLGTNCGQVSGTDNCGAARTAASCGTCTSPQTCGGGGTANVCAAPVCVPESDAAFCSRLGTNCGQVSGMDNCGAARTVASCGTCASPQTCGGGGFPNVCAAPSSFDVSGGGTATGTGTACSTNESVTQAYDDQTATKWCVTSAPTVTVPIATVYDFAGTNSYIVTSYSLTTAADAPDRDPRDWTLQGCQGSCTAGSDAGWVVLDTRTGQFAGAGAFQTNTYPVSNTTDYQQYRLRVTANNGSATLFQVAEIQLFGTAAACAPESDVAFCSRLARNCGQVSGTDNCGAARTVASCGTCASPQTCGGGGTANVCAAPSSADVTEKGTATGTGTACASSEGAAKAYDNQTSTKWCVTSAPTGAVPISTVYDFAGTNTFVVTSYTVTTANDQPTRDPKDWVLQGCQGTCTAGSDTGWVTLDTRTGQFAAAARFQTNTYAVSNATAYQQYRLRITANNGASNLLQLAEIQMFGLAGP